MSNTPKHISTHLHGLAGKLLGEEWRILSRIIQNWPGIVGNGLAEHGAPASLGFVNRPGFGRQARITVDIPGALAPQFAMQEEVMRQRINRLMGYEFVEKLVFRHKVETDRENPL